jgi:hypothetical protein
VARGVPKKQSPSQSKVGKSSKWERSEVGFVCLL